MLYDSVSLLININILFIGSFYRRLEHKQWLRYVYHSFLAPPEEPFHQVYWFQNNKNYLRSHLSLSLIEHIHLYNLIPRIYLFHFHKLKYPLKCAGIVYNNITRRKKAVDAFRPMIIVNQVIRKKEKFLSITWVRHRDISDRNIKNNL